MPIHATLTRLLTVTALGALLALALEPADASAQQVRSARTYVAIPDAFPEIDARAMLIREPGFDLVVLRDGEATPDALAMALLALRDARERRPVPKTGEMMPIAGFVVEESPTGRTRRVLERTLARLERADPTDLGSLGQGRRVRIPGR